MDLYIFRHAQTYFSKHNVPYGDKVESAEILPEGILAIRRLAKHLKKIKTDANFSSPFKRCIQTSEIVTEITGKNFDVDERLHDDIRPRETLDDLISRITNFCQHLQKSKYGSVAICTHGYPINALIAYFTKGFIREADLPNFPKCGVLVSVENKKVSYKDFNLNN